MVIVSRNMLKESTSNPTLGRNGGGPKWPNYSLSPPPTYSQNFSIFFFFLLFLFFIISSFKSFSFALCHYPDTSNQIRSPMKGNGSPTHILPVGYVCFAHYGRSKVAIDFKFLYFGYLNRGLNLSIAMPFQNIVS